MPLNDPVPSTAADVLKYNVERFDEVVTSDAPTYTDRLGKERLTVAGFEANANATIAQIESYANNTIAQIESEGEAAIQALRVVNAGSFEDGATLTARNEVLYYGAEQDYYRWDGALPKAVAAGSTPAGTGGVGSGAWVSVGDAALRSELSDPNKGAAIVARGVVAVDSIADLLALPEGQKKEGLRYLVRGYHAGSDMGGGEFIYDPDDTATPADGGMVFDAPGGGKFKRMRVGSRIALDTFAEYGVQPVAEEIIIYCDPDEGDDSNTGSRAAPLKTIAGALARVPYFIDNVRVEINLYDAPRDRGAASVFYDEDVMVGPLVVRGTGDRTDGESGNAGRLFFMGNPSNPAFVKIGSFAAVSCKGRDNPTLMWVRLARISPYDDNEYSACYFTSCDSGSVWGLSFDPGIETGICAYGSAVDARECDVSNLTVRGIHAKRNGRVTARDFTGTFSPADPDSSNAAAFDATEGGVIDFWDHSITLAPGARLLQGRVGGTATWVRQANVRIGKGVSDYSPLNSYANGYLGSDQVLADAPTSAVVINFNTPGLNNFQAQTTNGINAENNRLWVNPAWGMFAVAAQLTFELPAVLADKGGIELRIVNGLGDIIGQSYVATATMDATVRRVSLTVQAVVYPEGDAQLGRWRVQCVNRTGDAVTVIASPSATWFEVRRIGG